MIRTLKCQTHGVVAILDGDNRRIMAPPSMRPVGDCILMHQGYRFVRLGPGEAGSCRIVEEGVTSDR